MADVQQKGIFPSQAVPDAYKASPEYGMKVAKAVEDEWFKKERGSTRYFANKDNFHRLRLYARGEQSIQKYKDELSINGDMSYLNLDWKPVPIIPKFVDIVVNGIQERTYDIKAYSQDPFSINKRTQYVKSVVQDMRNVELLNAVQEKLDLNLFNGDPKTLPENDEELALHMQLDYKQSIETVSYTHLTLPTKA